jgi:hypothetical protein
VRASFFDAAAGRGLVYVADYANWRLKKINKSPRVIQFLAIGRLREGADRRIR